MAVETNSPAKKRVSSRKQGGGRIIAIGAALSIGIALLAYRLVVLQLIDSEGYAEQARRQYESKVALQADRGAIYDRSGNLLATNITSWSVAVDPTFVDDPEKLAKELAQILGGTYDEYLAKVSEKNTSFVWLSRKVTGAAIKELKKLDDKGLITIGEPLRRFEYGQLAAQVVGCTNIDNQGLGGVELFYNEYLKGVDGYMVMQRDAQGKRRPDVDLPRNDPEHGQGLVLTVDINVQGIVEDELLKGVQHSGAVSGTAIALDPHTGEILAMASYPTYDPNDMGNAEQGAVRVRGITDSYEPGSTMKIVTAAAALEEGTIAPDDAIDGEGGVYQIEGHTIRDDHSGGVMTFREALQWSSNIAFAKIAGELPTPRFYKYVRDFGFGIVTGIDLPGEAKGEVKKPGEFEDGTQEFMAFGYQLAVTPLQLVSAYAAIANGGLMMKPHMLKKRIALNGEVLEEIQPQQIRRVVSQETADTLSNMLVNVVEHGTGREARVPGLRIAGKTGTSQQLADGTYSKEKYNASFVGYFPADNPQMVLLVLLDSPTNGYYGGQVAAPIFREIARRVVNATMHETEPDVRYAANTQESVGEPGQASFTLVPDFRGIGAQDARGVAEAFGVRFLLEGEGTVVIAQQPEAGAKVEPHGIVTLITDSPSTTMPDVRGLTLRRGLNVLNRYRITPKIDGSGRIRTQYPLPGKPLAERNRTAALGCTISN